jgi:hypothetical protein
MGTEFSEKGTKMEAVATKKAPVLGVRQLVITGKVIRSRRYQDHTYTTVICPAADEYSKPQVVEVRSSRKFAEKDEVTTFVAQLGGFEGKPYESKDKSTGEISRVIPVTLYLDYVGE